MTARRKVALITGIEGGLARLVGRELAKHGYRLVGVDYRPLTGPLDYRIDLYQANYNKTLIEDIFRRHRPTHVLHLGRVGNLKEELGKRFDLNVMGSRKVMDLALKYGARRLVVLSTFHIYGAHPRNHIPIYEDEPLRAGTEFPQLADAIQLDNQALMWLYRHPQVPTALLRPCNVVGPRIQNSMSRFLRQPMLPRMIGFNPMTQFVHEDDMTRAVVAVCESETGGVFNVAGRSAIPWREALRHTRARVVPVPAGIASLYLRTAGLVTPVFPPHLVSFFKYPCVVADDAIRSAFEWHPQVDEVETIRSTIGREVVRGY